MKYQNLEEALDYFSKDASFMADMIDPVRFANVKNVTYHKAFVEGIFEEINMILRKRIANGSIAWDPTVTKNVSGKVYNLGMGQAICPYTKLVINQGEMQTDKQYLLFRNIFLLAAENYIKKNKEEFYENERPREATKRFLDLFDNTNLEKVELTPEEIKKASDTFADIQQGKITIESIKADIQNDKFPILKLEHLETLQNWEIVAVKKVAEKAENTPIASNKNESKQKGELEELENKNVLPEEDEEGLDEEMKLVIAMSKVSYEIEEQTRKEQKAKERPTEQMFSLLAQGKDEDAFAKIQQDIQNLDLNAAHNPDQKTLIDYAALYGCPQTLKYLLERGANITQVRDGKTTLQHAEASASTNKTGIMTVLQTPRPVLLAFMNKRNPSEKMFSLLAQGKDGAAFAEIQRNIQNIDINAAHNPDQKTLIDYAAIYGCPNTLRYLLDKGANIAQIRDGKSTLQYATESASTNKHEIINLLKNPRNAYRYGWN